MGLISLRDLGIVLVMGVVLGILGPFGTYKDLYWAFRFPYWIAAALLAWGQILLLQAALRSSPRLRDLPPLWVAVLSGMGAALPMTFIVAWVESSLRVGRPWPVDLLPLLLLKVATVSISIAIVWQALRKPAALPPAGHGVDVPAGPSLPTVKAEPVFLRRLPPHLGTQLLALEAEDHYLRVHTALGSDLLLMRLADAMDELHGLPGLQVHRSWWVSRDAISRVHREGGRMTLELVNGLRVPVSRTYRLAVRGGLGPATDEGILPTA